MSNESTTQMDLAQQTYGPIVGNRWIQLAAGVTAMVVISNFQYAFTLFTPGLKQQFASVPYSEIALIYTLFILFETWPVPLAGFFMKLFLNVTGLSITPSWSAPRVKWQRSVCPICA